jgi:hypothetical protein
MARLNARRAREPAGLALRARRGTQRHQEAVIQAEIRRMARAFGPPRPPAPLGGADPVLKRSELGEAPSDADG